jgi:hypothetical protein
MTLMGNPADGKHAEYFKTEERAVTSVKARGGEYERAKDQ